MNGTASRFARFSAALLGMVVLGWVLTGQAAKPAQYYGSVIRDWSHRQLIYSQPRSAERARAMAQDPRYWLQWQQRGPKWLAPEVEAALAKQAPRRPRLHRDWSVNLGTGASVGAGIFPAVFSADSTTARCATDSNPDFAVFGTGLPGSSTQPTIVAFDNLYAGCAGTKPTLYWAYNTQGTAVTSPLFSLDGTQVAYVQTTGLPDGELVLVKWKAGTFAASSVNEVNYRTCTAPCFTTVILRAGGTFVDDTTSSAFYDYASDIAWVGSKFGWLHKITNVFNTGTPTEVNTGGFPAQVPATLWLGNPVFDRVTGTVLVGDAGGFLDRIDATTGAVTRSGKLDFGTGIVSGPIVDAGAGRVYVFASNDNSADCAGPCAAVYGLSTSFVAGTTGTRVPVGASAVSPNPLYLGLFDNTYLKSANATGNLYVCGKTGAEPTLYQVPITAGIPGSAIQLSQLTTNGSNAACSPVTDFYNPNTVGGASEHVFVSVRNNGRGAGCGGGGCLMNFLDTPWAPLTNYQVGQEILVFSNPAGLFVNVAISAGTSAAAPPANWPNAPGATVTNGSVTWLTQQKITAAPLNAWTASHAYVASDHILDTNGNVEVISTPGTSDVTPPTFPTTAGQTVTDGTAVWINAGRVPTAALPAAGGTSGIVIDNIVSPNSFSGTSQIYFSTLADQLCQTSGTTGGCAVQASQPNLQ